MQNLMAHLKQTKPAHTDPCSSRINLNLPLQTKTVQLKQQHQNNVASGFSR